MSSTNSLSIITTTDPLTGHLPALLSELSSLAIKEKAQYEVVIVDDLQQWKDSAPPLSAEYKNLLINLITPSEHAGQLGAILNGISYAKGSLLLTIDPDLYPCVHEIPELLALLNTNTHAVHGVRKHRSDANQVRMWGSKFINWLICRITGLRIDDIGSPICLFKKEILTLLPSSEEERQINPRLLCYFKLADQLSSYTLRSSAVKGEVSHYTTTEIIRTTWHLIRNALKLRKISRMDRND